MAAGDAESWPYGAILPWALSRSIWHAWGSQMPAALAEASVALGDGALLDPAVARLHGVHDDPAHCRRCRQRLVAHADRPGADRLRRRLARAVPALGGGCHGQRRHSRSSRRCRRRGSSARIVLASRCTTPRPGSRSTASSRTATSTATRGAESTIHGLLTMIQLDARPEVAERATTVTDVAELDGLRVVEAEAATSTTGRSRPPLRRGPASRCTAVDVLVLERGEEATFEVGTHEEDRSIEPVAWLPEDAKARSIWNAGRTPLGTLDGRGEPQGISPVPGVLLPRTLQQTLPATSASVSARVVTGTVTLDALIVRPASHAWRSRARAARPSSCMSSATSPQRVPSASTGAARSRGSTAPTGRLLAEVGGRRVGDDRGSVGRLRGGLDRRGGVMRYSGLVHVHRGDGVAEAPVEADRGLVVGEHVELHGRGACDRATPRRVPWSPGRPRPRNDSCTATSQTYQVGRVLHRTEPEPAGVLAVGLHGEQEVSVDEPPVGEELVLRGARGGGGLLGVLAGLLPRLLVGGHRDGQPGGGLLGGLRDESEVGGRHPTMLPRATTTSLNHSVQ